MMEDQFARLRARGEQRLPEHADLLDLFGFPAKNISAVDLEIRARYGQLHAARVFWHPLFQIIQQARLGIEQEGRDRLIQSLRERVLYPFRMQEMNFAGFRRDGVAKPLDLAETKLLHLDEKAAVGGKY